MVEGVKTRLRGMGASKDLGLKEAQALIASHKHQLKKAGDKKKKGKHISV